MDLEGKLKKKFNELSDVDLGKLTRKLLRKIIKEDEEERQYQLDTLKKQNSCLHKNTYDIVSEYHPNGDPDRYSTYCEDCGKLISS